MAAVRGRGNGSQRWGIETSRNANSSSQQQTNSRQTADKPGTPWLKQGLQQAGISVCGSCVATPPPPGKRASEQKLRAAASRFYGRRKPCQSAAAFFARIIQPSSPWIPAFPAAAGAAIDTSKPALPALSCVTVTNLCINLSYSPLFSRCIDNTDARPRRRSLESGTREFLTSKLRHT